MTDRHQTAEQVIEVWNTRTSEQTIPVMPEDELTLIIEALTALTYYRSIKGIDICNYLDDSKRCCKSMFLRN